MVMVHCPWSPTQRERELNDTARRRSRLARIVTLQRLKESLLAAPSQADFEGNMCSRFDSLSHPDTIMANGDGMREAAAAGGGVMRGGAKADMRRLRDFLAHIQNTRQECDEAPPSHNIFA